ncbi:putative bifunctional diguanylate cyclase/phosphodiesterase [Mangrovihabitans endophyticus]|uniref:putative bifunctional diguanylate cyclase/phosphodiesterase n=1 Tax=Mangrovihabitans endophyticus TaxID=1751298 RepID=UPI001E4B665A|nr:EAL domain-containing protein [Mangrovihabitans endophyticus]
MPAVAPAVIPAAGAIALDLLLWLSAPGSFTGLPASFWVMALLAVAVDARPYVVPNRRASSVILPSLCFTFAIVLAWGLLPAIAVQVLSVAVAGLRMRRPARTVVHLGVQLVAGLAAAATVTALAGMHAGSALGWGDAAVTVVAAAAWTAARHAVAAATGRWHAAPSLGHRPAPRGAELLATAALLLLGPVVLAAASADLTLVPLVLLALHAVHRMVRTAGEQERAVRVDALTGLPNRRALHATVADCASRSGARSAPRQVALLVLDLDRFRNVNDALGHGVGDRLLTAVARRLTAVVPPHDLVVRLGGDEFAVLATRVDGPAAARRIAAHLVETLSRPFALDGVPVGLSASVGIALRSARGVDGAALLRQAEAAMYDAKQRGDQIAVYRPEAAHHPPARLTLLADLLTALRDAGPDDGIVLFYQPQVEVATGDVVGVEALLRWHHPSRGMIRPEELIKAAEATPAMHMLTDRVLHKVVAQVAAWREAGLPMRAAVNVSVRDLHDDDIAERIGGLLSRYAVPSDLLQLEITESALMVDPHRVVTTINRLDRMGVAISLDDFGTGYSSLQHLRRLPLSEVKIDRSFVLGMTADSGDAAIVRSVIELAEALHLRVVAEGVEDERTWRALAAVGCHAAQGWFHGRPMPAADLATWLSRYRPVSPGALPASTR